MPAPAAVAAPERLRFGLASYSTRMLSLDETIATVKVLRLANAALYKAQIGRASCRERV